MRSLVPADTLVYLETNDLAAALQPIIDNESFKAVAKSQPDLSALKGIQLAVTVSGFEMTEEKLTDEHSVGRVQPRFVAIAETHAWNWQAVSFAENKIGAFVMDIYRSDVSQDRTEKNGGTLLTWTANDGRKALAFVTGSLIYFGNDESAIEKSLAVKRGEADSIVKTGKLVPVDPATLATGYVSSDGIAQIANIIGVKFASEAGEDSDVQAAIVGIMPQLIRNSLTDITWTSTKTEQRFEDKYVIVMPTEIASVFSETMAPAEDVDLSLLNFVPKGTTSVTLYNLKNPQVAWRSVLLAIQKQSGSLVAKVIGEVSGDFFEPYAIGDPELFLSSVNSTLVTTKCDAEGEKPAVIATSQKMPQAQRSMLMEMKPIKGQRFEGGESWKSDDNSLGALFIGNKIAMGDFDCVQKIDNEEMYMLGEPMEREEGWLKQLRLGHIPIISTGVDSISAAQIGGMLSEKKADDAKADSTYLTKTRFTKTGIERRTISDFGLIGSILANLATEK